MTNPLQQLLLMKTKVVVQQRTLFSMQIRMRYFASFREIVGLNEETLSIPEETNVTGVRTLLLERYPRLTNALARAVCAVNHQYVPAETPLKEADEVVFIPPVGGGSTC